MEGSRPGDGIHNNNDTSDAIVSILVRHTHFLGFGVGWKVGSVGLNDDMFDSILVEVLHSAINGEGYLAPHDIDVLMLAGEQVDHLAGGFKEVLLEESFDHVLTLREVGIHVHTLLVGLVADTEVVGLRDGRNEHHHLG